MLTSSRKQLGPSQKPFAYVQSTYCLDQLGEVGLNETTITLDDDQLALKSSATHMDEGRRHNDGWDNGNWLRTSFQPRKAETNTALSTVRQSK